MMENKALVTRIGSSNDLIQFDDRKRELIRTTLAKDLVQNEFELFMAIASARGLDPVLNQIHAVKRSGKMVIQVGIDGQRLIASRTGEFAGCDEIVFEHNDKGGVIKAKATVYRLVNGVRCAFVGVALWDEFCPVDEKQQFMWKKMPYNQLGKCAEAQALRKGFPGDLSGIYAPEELQREEIDVTPKTEEKPSAFDDDARTKQIKEIINKFAKLGVSESDICRKFGVDVVLELTDEELAELNQVGAAIVNKRMNAKDAFPPIEEAVKF